MKQCEACQQMQQLDQYTRCKTAVDGLAPFCLDCIHEYSTKVHGWTQTRVRPARHQSPPKPQPKPEPKPVKTCSECGETPVVQAGRCKRHYNQYRYQEAKRRAAG